MTTATVTNVRGTERAVTSWLASTGWAIVLGAASGSACVAIRLFFRLLQWVFVQQTGMLPVAAATLAPARRIVTPMIGAALATLVVWMMRRWAPDLHFEEYVEAVRLRNGRIPLLATVWRTASSAFSVATGAAIGREGSMIQFATAVTEKLLTYALGRGVEYYDYPTVRSIDREAARDNYRISALILAIVKSTPFQMRRGSDS